MPSRKRFGEVAEAGFQHQGLAHGLSVAEPYGESDPFDFLAGKGRRFWRVQVKSTGTAPICKVYRVNSGRRQSGGRRAPGKRIPYTSAEVDFIAAYLGPENAWYIIPIALAEGKASLRIHGVDHPKRGP